jgi:light-regulated signal transduction histidine kinase (bacteriophytochrome)
MASHDLQEPLRKILMFSDRLFQKYQNVLQDDIRIINRIQKSAERMQALIIDILTFSKLSVDKTSFVKSDLNGIIQEIVIDIDDEIKEKNANITIDRLPSLHVNPRLMRLLFHNLLGNALKYSKKETNPDIKIRVETSLAVNSRDKKDLVNKYCRIFVEDNGIGFDQKYAEEVFGMFRRLHHDAEFSGTGIGLALCKKIVEQHNGYISAQSQINKGSRFIVSLPFPQEV